MTGLNQSGFKLVKMYFIFDVKIRKQIYELSNLSLFLKKLFILPGKILYSPPSKRSTE